MLKMSLEALRVNKKLTQKQAASAIGVSNKTICKWERGEAFPKQPQIEALCKLYGCSYDIIDFSAR